MVLNALNPGDFVTKVKQINSQSDLISMSTFTGPSYLRCVQRKLDIAGNCIIT